MALQEDELRAWQALLHAHHEITQKLDADLRDRHGLSFGSYDVLLRLARASDRELGMTELARRVLLSPSALTRKVDRLVEQGLVERIRSGRDARVVLVRLTDRGIQSLRRAARTHVRGIRHHFTGRLSERQLRSLASALESVVGPHQPH